MTNEGYQSILTGGSDSNKHDAASTPEALLSKTRQWSFAAGILYCVIIVCGFSAELGIRGSLLDFENAAATADNIQANPQLFRSALVLDMIMSCSDVVISFLLGSILVVAGASKILTFVSVGFRLMQQAVLATNLLHMFAASLLLDETLPVASVVDSLFTMDGEGGSKESLAFLFLLMHKYGYLLALIFFGFSMSIMGYVIWVSGVFPKWIGGLLFLAGMGYVGDSTLFFWMNGYDGDATAILMLPALLAEFGFTGCLLLKKTSLSTRT